MKTKTGKLSIIAAILALAAVLCSFAGCQEDKPEVQGETSAVTEAKPVVVDINAAAEALLNGVKFDDTLAQIEGDAVGFYYDVADGVSAVVYFGSGATAEEIAVFDGVDEEGAKTIEEMVKTHVAEQIESYRNYVPAEVARLEKAVIVREGQYVFLCVTYDVDTATGIINETLGK